MFLFVLCVGDERKWTYVEVSFALFVVEVLHSAVGDHYCIWFEQGFKASMSGENKRTVPQRSQNFGGVNSLFVVSIESSVT